MLASCSCPVNTSSFISKDSFIFEIELSFFLIWLGEQGWCSGESTRLPPMWPGFESWRRRHMWVEFVCWVFLRVLRFSPLLKNQHFQIPIRSGTHGHVSTSSYELLSALWVNKLQQKLQLYSEEIQCLFESWLEFLSFLSGRHLLNSTDGVTKASKSSSTVSFCFSLFEDIVC